MGDICNIFVVLILCLGIALGQTCTDTNLPAVPGYPTQTIATTPASSASNPLTTNHWSETARLGLFRNFASISSSSSQTNCPHKLSGLKNWHDASTWGSAGVPKNGADVTIPANTNVLISSCSIDASFTLGTITVPTGSSLIFGDAPINVRARGFNVDGSLLAGSETCRLRNKINITLVGSRPSQVPAPQTVKGISVQGTIDLHGALYTPTWTRLAMTARASDTIIYVQDIVNWQPGQRIAITTSELKDARDWHRNEERTIKSVKLTAFNTVSAIELTEPLQYKHFGGREYQVEVALLSRNIVVQGSETDSEPTDTANAICKHGQYSTYPCENSYLTGYGAHIFVNGARAQGRFSGVEMFRVGQTNALGRYPIHFHMIGDITASNYTSSYVRDSSVHRSYFRCYAIHGTSGVMLTQNTAYDAIGHCYFLEDGAEENNIISYNQAAFIHPLGKYFEFSLNNFGSQGLPEYPDSPTLILPSDMAAAGFYITNSFNDVYGNAASGGFAGFSLPSLRKLVKMFNGNLSQSPSVRPFRSAFRGNSAHSTGYWWASAGGVYVGGELRQEGSSSTDKLWYTAGRSLSRDTCSRKTARIDPNDGCWGSGDKRLWLRFEDNKVFLANRGLQNWGDRSELIRFEFHDVALSMNVFGSVLIDQMLMNCRSSSNVLVKWQGCTAGPEEWKAWDCNVRDIYFFYSITGFQWYDVSQQHILTNSIFRNCNGNWSQCLNGACNTAVFSSLTHSDQFVPEQMQISNQIKFQNCSRRWSFTTSLTSNPGYTVSGRNQNWLDYDGSVSDFKVKSMIGSARANEWWKYNSDCILQDEAYKCPMKPGDSAASVYFGYGTITQNGVSYIDSNYGSFCLNGGAQPFGTQSDPTPRNVCPTIGKVNHFGASDESKGYDLGGNPKVTGPIINTKGGWFVRFTGGTPAALRLSGIQVAQDDVLILAFPYPANTQFNIYHKGASWCNSCVHKYTAVDSIAKVRASFGDAYFWDNGRKTLYLRVISHDPYFPSPDVPQWTTPQTYSDFFTRQGLTILTSAYQTYIHIEATNCGSRCAPQNDVAVPAALNNPAPPTVATASITGSTISQPASSVGSAAAGSSTGTVGVVSTSKGSSTGAASSGAGSDSDSEASTTASSPASTASSPATTASPPATTASPSASASSSSGTTKDDAIKSGTAALASSVFFVLLAFALVLA